MDTGPEAAASALPCLYIHGAETPDSLPSSHFSACFESCGEKEENVRDGLTSYNCSRAILPEETAVSPWKHRAAAPVAARLQRQLYLSVKVSALDCIIVNKGLVMIS